MYDVSLLYLPCLLVLYPAWTTKSAATTNHSGPELAVAVECIIANLSKNEKEFKWGSLLPSRVAVAKGKWAFQAEFIVMHLMRKA